MKRKITVLFFLLFLPMLVFAGTTGKIKGKVTDLQTGEPLIGANVIVSGTSLGAATDVKGEYTISNLNAGVYELKATYLGYKTVTISQVRVNADLTTEIQFQLPATGISVGEVEIVAQRPLVNKSNTNAIRTTSNEVIDALPVRGVDNIVALTPGVTLQSGVTYIRGGRQDEVGYYLEGTNITNAFSSVRAGGQFATRQVSIPQDAIEEISVQAGGYTAEFGGANAGIVRTELKSGGPKLKASLEYLTDNWTFKSSKNRWDGKKNLGTYSYGYNDNIGTLSGPLIADNIKFFALFENVSQADRSPSFNNGINLGTLSDNVTPEDANLNVNYPAGAIKGNTSNQYSGVATITLDYNPIIIRLLGTYSYSTQRVMSGDPTYVMYDLNRLPIRENRNGDFGIKLTHILSPSTYYEVNASYIINTGRTYDPQLDENFWVYGDSVANTKAGVPWYRRTRESDNGIAGRYQVPLNYQLFSSFSFAAPNTPLIGADNATSIVNYNKYKNSNIDVNAALSSQLSKEHSLKVGGEIQIMEFSSYTPTSAIQNIASLLANNPTMTKEQIMVLEGVNNYGYDVLGNDYTGSTNYASHKIAPHRPIFAGAYVQDRMEYKNLIVNAGIRYDYINTDNTTLKNPYLPGLAYNTSTGDVKDASQFVKVPSFSSVSPRIGFSFPITDQTVFHAQYGKFVQQPSLSDLYMSPYSYSYWINPNNGYFNGSTIVGQNLRPTRTTQYEIGFTQQVGSFASIDITAFYKDIADQVVYGTQNVDESTGWRPYTILTNGDFATTQGVELSFDMRRTQRFLVNGSIAYQDAKGTGDNPYSTAGEVGSPLNKNYVYVPVYINPLSYNHSFTGHLNIDYRYGKDDGPSILHEFGASLLLSFAAGHPYTLGTGSNISLGTSNPGAYLSIDARNRYAAEALNASTTPSTFQADLRLDKSFSIMDQVTADIYIYVINLFNTKNVTDVYTRTGVANDDGYLTDPNMGGYKQTQKYGSDFSNFYTSDLQYGGLYGVPRQIRLGLRLEY
ncbi:MAG: TonB-dependent receptor [Ignavibacteriaceae bacterium]|nr:TonB-dependent receptor [Ignavibacteriaceae bacterium]